MVNDGQWWHHLPESVVNNDDLPLKSWLCSIIEAQKLAGTLESESNDLKNQEELAFHNAPEDHFRYQFPHHFRCSLPLWLWRRVATWSTFRPSDPGGATNQQQMWTTTDDFDTFWSSKKPWHMCDEWVRHGTNAGFSSLMCQTEATAVLLTVVRRHDGLKSDNPSMRI